MGVRLPGRHIHSSKQMDWPVRVMDVRQVIRRWEDSPAQTWPVGSLRPNDLGLFDVFGNAAEWCENFEDVKNRVTARLSWLGGEESLRPVRGGFLPRRASSAPLLSPTRMCPFPAARWDSASCERCRRSRHLTDQRF